jgi:hypothetical protein
LNQTLTISIDVWENPEVLIFIKINSVGSEFLHADGRKNRYTDRQTDMTKLIVAFRSFEKSPKCDGLIMDEMCDVAEYNIEDEGNTLGGLCVRLVLMLKLNALGMVEIMVISEWRIVCYLDRSGLHLIKVTCSDICLLVLI